VEEFRLGDGRKLFLLGEGRLVNLAAAEGHPAAVMDMSFANQALGAEWIATNHSKLEKTVYELPDEVDKEIATLKLHAMDVRIDTLTEEHERSATRSMGRRPRPGRCSRRPCSGCCWLPSSERGGGCRLRDR